MASSYEEVTRILEQCRISHFRQAFVDNECDDAFLDIVEDGDLRAPISLCAAMLKGFLEVHFPTKRAADPKLVKDVAKAEAHLEAARIRGAPGGAAYICGAGAEPGGPIGGR